ncbi:MAG TPA: PAS domain S-box protein [Opitutus sp.]|nr:PAS domain S-box protein [Opitutus sp.]
MRVLHLEDSAPDAELVAARLAAECPDCTIQHAASREQFEAALDDGAFDLILSDYTLQNFDGLSALEIARERCPAKPFIFLSGTIGEERAIEALRRGATDYVIKDRPSRLVPAIRQALAHATEEQQLRQTEEALRQNRERFRQIAENVADLILMFDRSGRCVYCNPAYTACTSRAENGADLDPTQDVHPDDRAAMVELLQGTLETGESRRSEYRLLRHDGSVRDVEAQSTVVRDPTGAVSQVLIVARDVTERRAATERIERQAALLDRAQDAILMRDMDDRITYWNQSAARIYGWTPQEAQGREATALWNEDPAQVEAARGATLFYGEWMGEMRQRSRHGHELVMQSRWSLVHGKDGNPAGFLVINTDVAEKKRLESQILRVQRTESIGLLAGGVAHDINNVLVPILSATDILEPLVGDPEARRFLATIRSSAQHGAALIRQLLAFARGAVGQPTELAVQPLLTDFVGFATQMLPRTITVTLETAADLWPIRGDAIQLKQVLVNLCLNARDAMPSGGKIALRAANHVVSELEASTLREIKSGPHLVISVADSGSGMTPEVLEKIFDPFFTTKELGKGTGLGLAAVRGIVKGHNGTIVVESQPQRGTTFRIYLPATPRPATHETVRRPPVEKPRGAGEGILLVDDEPSVRDILSTLLHASGYRVFKASSGREALRLYRENADHIALVLTDVSMPDGDGFTMATELRHENVELPIVVMSGMAAAGQYDEKAQRLRVPLLAKPITREALIDAVQRALTGARPS